MNSKVDKFVKMFRRCRSIHPLPFKLVKKAEHHLAKRLKEFSNHQEIKNSLLK